MSAPSIEVEIEDLTPIDSSDPLFANVSMHFNGAGLHALVGPSGIGKTSILRAIAGLKSVRFRGRVRIALSDEEGSITPEQLQKLGQIAILTQGDGLIHSKNVRDNILLPEKLNPKFRSRQSPELWSLAERLSIDENLIASYPKRLSFGQQRRVQILRTLAHGARVVVLDEPYNGQDRDIARKIHSEIVAFAKRTSAIVLIVTHWFPVDEGCLASLWRVREGDVARVDSTDDWL